jgi:hypothetical protein
MRCFASIIILASQISFAQESLIRAGDPFSKIEFSAGGSTDVGRNFLHDFWRPGYGGELALSTPFYFGEAEAGGAYHVYDMAASSVPRFDAILVFVGWGIALSPSPHLSWYNGFRVGNNRMSFDDDTFPGIRNESELMLGANSRLHLRLRQGIGIFGSAWWSQTYTNVRFRSIYVSAGLSYRATSPNWIRTLLR